MRGIWRGNDRRTGWLSGVCIVTLLSVVACSEGETPAAEQQPAAVEAEALPGGYTVRLDSENDDPDQFQLSQDPESIQIMTGPAGIAFQSEDRILSGDFRVEAAFVQYGAPVGYREAYGLFVGGRELDSVDHEYTYLLVRPTGDFLVKRRIGEITETIVDWTPHDAVATVVAEGDEPENALAIEVVAGETRFLVNGTAVHTMPSSEARPYGVAGLRANHRLDIRVTGWLFTAADTEHPT